MDEPNLVGWLYFMQVIWFQLLFKRAWAYTESNFSTSRLEYAVGHCPRPLWKFTDHDTRDSVTARLMWVLVCI